MSETGDGMIGRVIDDCYRIDDLLGEGGFGVVYAAHDVKLARQAAIKMLKSAGATPRDLQRFLSEARHLASLNHPNVVQIYRLGEYEQRHYIAMELIDGDTLGRLIRTGQLSLRRRLEVMRQVACGLGALHQIGLLHRDLSPANIMVTAAGPAKILDLGLSRDTRLSTHDSSEVVRGTIAYFAPEQVSGEGCSVPSEIFTFGVILYESICGENPFAAEQLTSLLYNIAHRDPEPIAERVPGCPPGLAELVHACLARRPAERPADMQEVERRLERVLAGPGLDAQVPSAPAETPRHAPTSSNPYLNRVMIKRREDFFGRRTEVQRIFARLNATPPGSISIVGDRKIGKSSLLNHIYSQQQRHRHLEQPDRMLMVFLDLQVEKNMSMPSFVDKLLGLANIELRGRLDVSDCARSLDGIRDMVQRLDEAGFRLAVLLDEFEAVTTNPNFDLEFFSFLRYLANHYNVAYLTSSARNLQVLCHTKEISDSPFFNIFSSMRLPAFQRAEAEELITAPSARVGTPLAPHVEPILALSGLFPFFLQMACAHTLEHLHERPNQPPEFADIRRRFYEEASLHYQYIWDSFDEHERSAVRAVAGGKRIPDSLRHVVDELAGRQYVTPGDRPALFSGPFADFVASHDRRERPEPLWKRWLPRARS
jgi:serine/threonine protein kinase